METSRESMGTQELCTLSCTDQHSLPFFHLNQEAAMRRHVRVVDDKGRAQATGKRKTSIARVWVWPGQGERGLERGQNRAPYPQEARQSHQPSFPILILFKPSQGT